MLTWVGNQEYSATYGYKIYQKYITKSISSVFAFRVPCPQFLSPIELR